MKGILPLRLEDVSFAAGGRTLIDRVSLSLEAGTSTIVLGANGAGKSVLMRLMHGLLAPSAGRVAWGETHRCTVDGCSPRDRRRAWLPWPEAPGSAAGSTAKISPQPAAHANSPG